MSKNLSIEETGEWPTTKSLGESLQSHVNQTCFAYSPNEGEGLESHKMYKSMAIIHEFELGASHVGNL